VSRTCVATTILPIGVISTFMLANFPFRTSSNCPRFPRSGTPCLLDLVYGSQLVLKGYRLSLHATCLGCCSFYVLLFLRPATSLSTAQALAALSSAEPSVSGMSAHQSHRTSCPPSMALAAEVSREQTLSSMHA